MLWHPYAEVGVATDVIGDPVDGLAVEAAYAAFGSDLRRAVMARVRDSATADDVLQDTFLRLHLAVVNGSPPVRVGPWLHRVASNLVISRGRHGQVVFRCLPRLVRPDRIATPEDIAVRRESDERLVEALGALRPTERSVLLLAAAGLTGPEIAARLGRSPVAVRALLCRARKHLRDGVEPG